MNRSIKIYLLILLVSITSNYSDTFAEDKSNLNKKIGCTIACSGLGMFFTGTTLLHITGGSLAYCFVGAIVGGVVAPFIFCEHLRSHNTITNIKFGMNYSYFNNIETTNSYNYTFSFSREWYLSNMLYLVGELSYSKKTINIGIVETISNYYSIAQRHQSLFKSTLNCIELSLGPKLYQDIVKNLKFFILVSPSISIPITLTGDEKYITGNQNTNNIKYSFKYSETYPGYLLNSTFLKLNIAIGFKLNRIFLEGLISIPFNNINNLDGKLINSKLYTNNISLGFSF